MTVPGEGLCPPSPRRGFCLLTRQVQGSKAEAEEQTVDQAAWAQISEPDSLLCDIGEAGKLSVSVL